MVVVLQQSDAECFTNYSERIQIVIEDAGYRCEFLISDFNPIKYLIPFTKKYFKLDNITGE